MEEAKELHAPVRRKFCRRRIITKGIDDLWAADLLIMDKYSRQNEGFKYLLNVIDTFSKYVWIEPLKNKTGKCVSEAFESIITKSERKPYLLHVDMGREFVNKIFKSMLKKYNINMYHTYNEEKSAIIERFNRTLNQKLKIYFEARDNFKWYDILPKVIKEYNNKDIHRTIGMRPIEVNKDNEEEILMKLNKSKCNATDPKFKIGDKVRIYAYKKVFGNKYKNNWTREIFIIDKVFYTNPVTYSIKAEDEEEILGKFYNQELLKTKF
jgi:hypothetical protein